MESEEFNLAEASDQFLFAEAQLGLEMSEFLRSNVGRYLIGRCEAEIADFNGWVLDQADPNSDEFRRRHAEARGAQKVVKFINEAVVNGARSQHELEERDDHEQYRDGPLE